MGAFIIDQNMTPGCGDWSNRGAAPSISCGPMTRPG